MRMASFVKIKSGGPKGPRRTGGRPPSSEIEERRLHLVAVATRLFLDEGYEATSLEKIAKFAGASKATIYRNFGDKADLFRVVVNQLVDPLWPRPDQLHLDRDPPEATLRALGYTFLTVLDNPSTINMVRLVYRESPRFPELSSIYAEAERKAAEAVSTYLAAACDKKLLRIRDCTWAAAQFFELVLGVVTRRVMAGTSPIPNQAERERIVDSAVELFLHGYG
jgi:AcrR family transcriptional regulator